MFCRWSTAADEDYDSRTPNNSVSKRLSRPGQGVASQKITTKTPPIKRLIDRAESSSSVSQVNASATDTYMNRLSSCTFKPVSTTAAETQPSLKRLFRCGVCFEKFTQKDICLAHIAEQHSGVQKPVQPNTIFEAIRKGVVATDSPKTAEPTSATGRIPSKASSRDVSHTLTATKQLTNGEASESHNELSSSEGGSKSQETPKKLGTKRRKVLAIDSFYLEEKKQCTRYVCDDCGRMMMSRFAFLRHLHDHREPFKPAPPVMTEPSKRKRLPLPDRRYCSVCKKSVRDGVRHRMYHAIVKLESQFPSSASMLANLTWVWNSSNFS